MRARAGLESRGFLLGPALALELDAAFVPVRKRGKLPGAVVRVSYDKEYGSVSLAAARRRAREARAPASLTVASSWVGRPRGQGLADAAGRDAAAPLPFRRHRVACSAHSQQTRDPSVQRTAAAG